MAAVSSVGHAPDEMQPSLLSPQEKFGRAARQFRSSESFENTALMRGRLEAALSKSHSRRGLCAVERSRLQILVPPKTQVPTPPVPPPTRQLASVAPIGRECLELGRTKNESLAKDASRTNPWTRMTREAEERILGEEIGRATKRKTMSRAWSEQNKSLAKDASAAVNEVHISMPWWLSLFGFQQSQCKSAIVMLLYTTAIFCSMVASVAMQLERMRFILVMGLCSAACILQMNFRRPGQQSVVQATSEMFLNNEMLPDYVDLWLQRSRRSRREVVFLMFLSMAAETAVVLWTRDELPLVKAVVRLAVFATVATAYSAVALYLLLVCSAQAAMVDNYSATAADLSQDYKVLRHRWDQIQAVLRRSAQCLAPCLLILTLTPVIVGVTSSIDLLVDSENDAQSILVELFPKCCGLLGITRVLSRIGEVTGNCARLPVFLNSLLLGNGFDEEASHLIHFIERSDAGFYAFDAKIDYTVMSRVAYVFSGGLVALLSRVVKF
ncbi:unnamed protein product [Polarella glacialis]|uniref:Gustatory receptor n=1 Tax=Polarella glacialis TaxID=89957 RepID=A0A813L196_POLGL|nr:unnamed protein product [Polarella glacialis]